MHLFSSLRQYVWLCDDYSSKFFETKLKDIWDMRCSVYVYVALCIHSVHFVYYSFAFVISAFSPFLFEIAYCCDCFLPTRKLTANKHSHIEFCSIFLVRTAHCATYIPFGALRTHIQVHTICSPNRRILVACVVLLRLN